VHGLFTQAGIEVIAPTSSEIVSEVDGFVLFAGEQQMDPRMIELLYLHNLRRLGQEGFSYFVNPDGYIGQSASYELGIAQVTNTRCFFSSPLKNHPAYIHKNAVWKPEDLAAYVLENGALPQPLVKRNETALHKLWEDLMVPGSIVATGGIIEYQPGTGTSEKEILLVKTHKWGGRYSIIGGKVRRNEQLSGALVREVKEETGLTGQVGRHICTFDQLRNSGYYKGGIEHIFVDNVVAVTSQRVRLNDEAEDYIWTVPREALSHLDIEPNARHILELYLAVSQ
jgi:8-oxo-dGTP pyrophosphatase MutT (NUDIX family)